MVNQNDILYQKLKSAKQFKDIMKTFQQFHKVNNANCQEYVTSHNIDIVCRRGCVYCCYLKVDAGSHEIFLINHHIATNFSVPKKNMIIASLKKHRLQLSKIAGNDHLSMNIPCPLLFDKACSIYPARPFACRAYYSLGVSSCRYSFENPSDLKEKRPTDPNLDSQWGGVRTAVAAIFHQLGFDITNNELGTALLYSFQHPKAVRRSTNKEVAFGDCEHTKTVRWCKIYL